MSASDDAWLRGLCEGLRANPRVHLVDLPAEVARANEAQLQQLMDALKATEKPYFIPDCIV